MKIIYYSLFSLFLGFTLFVENSYSQDSYEDSPVIYGKRIVDSNYDAIDTVYWEPTTSHIDEVVGYYFRLAGGQTPWAEWIEIYIDDPNVTSWNNVDDGDGPYEEGWERWFQVRYDFGDNGLGPWSDKLIIEMFDDFKEYIYPDTITSQVPTVTASREVLANGKVKDTMTWTTLDNMGYLIGYDTRRTTDGGRTWWTSDGYVDDPAVLTWNSKDDAGQEWRNVRRGFQVRYDFGPGGYGWWSKIFYVDEQAPPSNPNDPDTSQVPTVTASREILSNGKVKDTINWTAPNNTNGLVGYDTRRTINDGGHWWTSGGYVSDPSVTTWNSQDNAGQEWDNRRRGFQVRYDFGSDGYGPWSEIFYID